MSTSPRSASSASYRGNFERLYLAHYVERKAYHLGGLPGLGKHQRFPHVFLNAYLQQTQTRAAAHYASHPWPGCCLLTRRWFTDCSLVTTRDFTFPIFLRFRISAESAPCTDSPRRRILTFWTSARMRQKDWDQSAVCAGVPLACPSTGHRFGPAGFRRRRAFIIPDPAKYPLSIVSSCLYRAELQWGE